MSALVVRAMGPRPGSIRLILVRWAIALLAALPGIAAARATLSGAVANRPWYAEAPDPLPIPQFFGLMGELSGAIPVLFVGVILAWFLQQMLTSAAVEILEPGRRFDRVRVARRIFATGGRFFFVNLRIAILALLGLLLGARIVAAVFDSLGERAVLEGWTGATLLFTLPLVRICLLLAWAGFVGTCAWWARVIMVRGDRRRVRRLWTLVPRVLWRYPVQGLVLQVLLATVSVLAGGTLLFFWRQAPGTGSGWFAAWLLLLLVQAIVWHWKVRWLNLLWSSARLDDLRDTPDTPWGLLPRFIARLRARRAPIGDPASDSAG